MYLGSKYSSSETRARAKALAAEIGSNHREVDIDAAYQVLKGSAESALEREVRFASEGGSNSDDLSLQNLQARTRMVMAYLLAQTLPTSGYLQVLGSANLD